MGGRNVNQLAVVRHFFASSGSLILAPALRRCHALRRLGSELRIAETRAVNRALRRAYGIGICSLEEVAAKSHG